MQPQNQILDARTKGGRKRLDILRFIASNPGKTAYEIAKEHYPNPLLGYKSVRIHLKMLEDAGFVRSVTVRDGRASRVYELTDQGRVQCLRLGISLPSTKAEEIIAEFSQLSQEPLGPEIREFRAALTENLLEACRDVWAEWWGREEELLRSQVAQLKDLDARLEEELREKTRGAPPKLRKLLAEMREMRSKHISRLEAMPRREDPSLFECLLFTAALALAELDLKNELEVFRKAKRKFRDIFGRERTEAAIIQDPVLAFLDFADKHYAKIAILPSIMEKHDAGEDLKKLLDWLGKFFKKAKRILLLYFWEEGRQIRRTWWDLFEAQRATKKGESHEPE